VPAEIGDRGQSLSSAPAAIAPRRQLPVSSAPVFMRWMFRSSSSESERPSPSMLPAADSRAGSLAVCGMIGGGDMDGEGRSLSLDELRTSIA